MITLQVGGSEDGIDPCPTELQQLLQLLEEFSGAVVGQNVGP
jgi:hypothetical protein